MGNNSHKHFFKLTQSVAGLGASLFLFAGLFLQVSYQVFYFGEDGSLTFRYRGLALFTFCALGGTLSVLLLLPVVNNWIRKGEGKARLLFYLSGVAATLSLSIILFPAWMPFPIDLGAALLLLASTLGMAYWWRYRHKFLVLVILGASAGLFLPVLFVSQIQKIKDAARKVPTPIAMQVRLAKVFLFDAMEDTRISFKIAAQDHPIFSDSQVETIRLRVPRNSIKNMAARLPASAKEKYYSAEMLYPDGQWHEINYRFRGRNIWHWLPQKPSFRLKLKKSSPLDFQRHINLVNPEDRAMVRNILGEEVARTLGVLTHVSSFARLFINNQYFGLYHRTTREDEEMLRLNERVPGPIFIGDHLNDPWVRNDFEIAGNTDVLKSVSPMAQMTDAISMPLGPERYSLLWGSISLEKLSRWHAAMQLVGGFHTDYTHNNLFYFDPRLGLLEPITSDLNGHGMLTFPKGPDRHFSGDRGRPVIRQGDAFLPLGERLTPLLDAALKDPRFQHRRNELLYDSLRNQKSSKAQMDLISGYVNKIRAEVYPDRNKASLAGLAAGWFRQPYTNSQFEEDIRELRRWIKERERFLLDELLKINITVNLTGHGEDVLGEVIVDGNSAVEFDSERMRRGIFSDTARDGSFVTPVLDTQVLHPSLKEDFEYWYRYTNGRRVPSHFLTPSSQTYLFKFKHAAVADVGDILQDAFSSALTKKPITPTITTVSDMRPSDVRYNRTGMHIWELARSQHRPVVFKKGVHILGEDLFIPKDGKLVIEAGAILKLKSSVSIIVEGQMLVKGTSSAPVQIGRHHKDIAWGGILLLGKDASESTIMHAEINGGSFPSYKNVIASGMISVYGVPTFSLENSIVGSNVASDDTFHGVYGALTLRNTVFTNCNRDCIDFDYVTGEVENLEILEAGNDGLDLMTSRINVVGFSAEQVVDKAISIGELSEVNARDISIHFAETGIAVKDKSRLRVANAVISKSSVGMDIFSKNWRYGGAGNAYVKNSIFENNNIDVRVIDDGVVRFDSQSKPQIIVGDGEILQE